MQKLTIGRKLCLGFGILTLSIAVLGLIAYMGVNGIVADSMSMVTGGRINEVLKQREIDHLNWLSKLTHFMQDINTKQLDIQTDDHQCGFGKWLYGNERKQAESDVPDLVPVLKAIEEPHRVLHQSAVEISRYFNKLDTGKYLSDFYRLERDHLLWYETAIEEVVQKKEKLSAQLDDHACKLGQWLYNSEAEQLQKEYPDFAPLLEQLKEPHKKLHDSGRLVNEKLARADFSGAMDLVQGQAKQSMEEVQGILRNVRDLVRKKSEEQEQARTIFSTVSMKNIAELQSLMHQASERVSGHMTSQDSVLNATNKLKLAISIISVLAALIGVTTALIICASVKRPLGKLRDTLSDASEQVAAASTQVSASSQHLAEGASQQAGSLEETSASLEEMASMTKQNADNANQANSLMREAGKVVERASGSMLGMVASMQEISRASEEIQKIIKTIDEIAFQTNLLALNAAVEAARAGEAGSGFAVVADEVRNLAMRAADAAKNTATLIEGSVNTVSAGEQLVEETNKEFSEVAGIVRKSGELIGEIASASEEQAQGIEQLNRAITEMDRVTQQNATTAEQSASSAEEMSSQAGQMKEFVSELAALVGGESHTKKRGLSDYHAGTSRTSFATLPPIATDDASNSRSVIPREPGNAKELSPEKIFPLDNDF